MPSSFDVLLQSSMMQKRSLSTVVGVSVCLIVLLCTSESACSAKAVERILHFPTNYSVGNLMALQQPPELYGTCQGIPVAKACGLVKLPPGKPIKFEPNSTFYQHPDCLLKLPPNAFDYIELRFLSMTDQEDSFSDRVIPLLGHISSLKGIDLDKSETTDRGLSQLAAMPELQSITACDSKVSGSCLHDLAGCKKLAALRLSNIQVNNESLGYLKNFPHLERLALVRVNLSLNGLERVSKCKGLSTLDIDYNNEIDDRAVPLLLKLPMLTILWIKGTKVSLQGLELLSKHGVTNISLPKPFHAYSLKEQQRIKKAFPGKTFDSDKSPTVDPFTRTMFAPMTR